MPRTKSNTTNKPANKPEPLDLEALEAELAGLKTAELTAFAKKECPDLLKEAGEAWDELTNEQKAAAIFARVKKDSTLGNNDDDGDEEEESEEVGDGYRLGDESTSAVDVLGPNGERVRTYNSSDHGSKFKTLAKEFVAKGNAKLKEEEK